MNVRRWIGAIAHLLLGLAFPYVLIGTVILLSGFMAPSTAKQKLAGAVIAIAYLGLIAAVNYLALKGMSRRNKTISAFVHVIAFAAASMFMFWTVRR